MAKQRDSRDDYLTEDDAPTQAEREKMSEHEFGDPENKKYPLDSPKRIKSASSYVEKEHNAGRLSDAKYKEIRARINAAEKKHGIGAAGADSAGDDVHQNARPYSGGMTDEERRALEQAQANAKTAADKLTATEDALTQARSELAAAKTATEQAAAKLKADNAELEKIRAENAKLKTEGDVLKLQLSRETLDAAQARANEQAAKTVEDLVKKTIDVRATATRIIGKSFKHDGKNIESIKLEVLKDREPQYAGIQSIEDGLTSADASAKAMAVARLDAAYELVVAAYDRSDNARADIRSISATAGQPERRDAGAGGGGDDEKNEPDVGKARKAMEDRKRDGWTKTPKRIDRMRTRAANDRRSA